MLVKPAISVSVLHLKYGSIRLLKKHAAEMLADTAKTMEHENAYASSIWPYSKMARGWSIKKWGWQD